MSSRIGGVPASSIGAIASRVCSSLREKPKSKLKSLQADDAHGKLQIWIPGYAFRRLACRLL
jgi:hypothetical protein